MGILHLVAYSHAYSRMTLQTVPGLRLSCMLTVIRTCPLVSNTPIVHGYPTVPGAVPIKKGLYRLSEKESQELKEQLIVI